jgi:DNA polymerase-3 subunit epsilon
VRQVFLDTETTGLSPESGDRIIEIGCVEIVNRRLTGRRVHFYVNPERRNSIDAYKVHGLSDEFLADKPLFAHIVDELIEFVRDAEIIIHNAAFDVGFLDAELRRSAGRRSSSTACASPTPCRWRATASPASRTRSMPVQALRGQQHRARAARRAARRGLLAEVYIRMTRGQDSLVIDAGDRIGGRAGGAADRLQRAHARSSFPADEDDLAGHARCSRRSTRRAADALSGASRQRCRPARHGTMTAFRRRAFAPRAGG